MTTSVDLPRFGLVVPSLNQAAYLEQALASVLAQGYPHLEIVVMDGGSRDGSVAIIERHAAWLHHWRSGPDGGQSDAINAGVAVSSGELVGWLNSDDRLADGALWAVAEAYLARPDAGLYVGNGWRLDNASGALIPFSPRHMALCREDLRHWAFCLQQPSVFFARAAWETVGGLDPALHYCMDWDIVLRIADTFPAVLLHEYLSVSREHGETKTRCGGFRRAMEIIEMLRARTGAALTAGGLHYLMETVVAAAQGFVDPKVERAVAAVARLQIDDYVRRRGKGFVFPAASDPQDRDHIPLPPARAVRPRERVEDAPRVTVIVVAGASGHELSRTLDSVRAQSCPATLRIIDAGKGPARTSFPGLEVIDARSAADVCGAVRQALGPRDSGVFAILEAGERLAADALAAASAAFAGDRALEMVTGNALWVDDLDRLCPVDMGSFTSGLWPAGAAWIEGAIGAHPLPLAAPRATVFVRPDRLGLGAARSTTSWLDRLRGARRVLHLDRVQALLPPGSATSARSRLAARAYFGWEAAPWRWPAWLSRRGRAPSPGFCEGERDA